MGKQDSHGTDLRLIIQLFILSFSFFNDFAHIKWYDYNLSTETNNDNPAGTMWVRADWTSDFVALKPEKEVNSIPRL